MRYILGHSDYRISTRSIKGKFVRKALAFSHSQDVCGVGIRDRMTEKRKPTCFPHLSETKETKLFQETLGFF